MNQETNHHLTPELGRYDFDGACAPHSDHNGDYQNFTLGIFQWVAKAGYRVRQGIPIPPAGLKRTKIFRRINGHTVHPELAYREARKLCAGYNDGTLVPPNKHFCG